MVFGTVYALVSGCGCCLKKGKKKYGEGDQKSKGRGGHYSRMCRRRTNYMVLGQIKTSFIISINGVTFDQSAHFLPLILVLV